ncbi:putative agmatinase [Pyronema omphalodes]|nr:putative agmatinase [Pyronema omphalodes]
MKLAILLSSLVLATAAVSAHPDGRNEECAVSSGSCESFQSSQSLQSLQSPQYSHPTYPTNTTLPPGWWNFTVPYSGITTFAHLPYTFCLSHPSETFDIGIIGAPFDTGTSYRPGARFGPRALRAGSQRQFPAASYNALTGVNPYASWAKIVDCGDIPLTSFSSELALVQMTVAFEEIMRRKTPARGVGTGSGAGSASSDPDSPLLVTLGGDHGVILGALRAIHKVHGPVAVLHFDAHIDTWNPEYFPGTPFNHGTMLNLAGKEGLISNNSNVHAGLRTALVDMGDYRDDTKQGWMRIGSEDIDDLGVKGVVEKIVNRLKGKKVYLSFDIDTLDPAVAPGTGTPEAGGWTMREVKRILRAVTTAEDIELVGMDIVEVAPAYDNQGEITALAGAQIVFEVLSGYVKKGELAGKKAA